jgi:hypothetical protein
MLQHAKFYENECKSTTSLTWHICRIIVDSLGPIVSTCILNQAKGHWLLNDALNFTISMNLKFRDEIDYATFDNLMEEDGNVVYELSYLAFNIIIKVQVLDFFISFLKIYEKKKPHNMLFLMSDLRFKTFRLVSSLISCDQGKVFVEEHDKKIFISYVFKMLLSFACID